jgi:hypothetical protein
MPLVFVHGVNVRKGELYDRELAFRNRHFVDIFYKQLGLEVQESDIFNPYWGELGATLSPELPFLPRGSYELLWRKVAGQTSGSHIAASMHEEEESDSIDAESKTPLLDMAKTASIAEVIDVL